MSGIYDPSIKYNQSHEEQQANMVRSKSSSANTLVLFVKSKDDNDIEKINEYPIDIDEKHQLFYIRKDPVNRFKSILSLIEFYTVSDHDRLVLLDSIAYTAIDSLNRDSGLSRAILINNACHLSRYDLAIFDLRKLDRRVY